MNLADVQARLQAPFPAHLVGWKPQAFSKDKTRALLVAYLDARAIQSRLDAICPESWSFDLEVIQGAAIPTVKGSLTVLGVTRSDIGEADTSTDAGTIKAAASDALKRCAVQFGIGRYLYDLPKFWEDWDAQARAPKSLPDLPQWALPEHQRTPGGAYLIQALDQLRYELPTDHAQQREVYKHLKAALGVTAPQPTPPSGSKPTDQQATPTQSEVDPLGGALDPEEAPQPAVPSARAMLNRDGAANLHRQLGPCLRGLKDAEVKAWVSEQLGRLISSFEQIYCDEIFALKKAARQYEAQQEAV